MHIRRKCIFGICRSPLRPDASPLGVDKHQGTGDQIGLLYTDDLTCNFKAMRDERIIRVQDSEPFSARLAAQLVQPRVATKINATIVEDADPSIALERSEYDRGGICRSIIDDQHLRNVSVHEG